MNHDSRTNMCGGRRAGRGPSDSRNVSVATGRHSIGGRYVPRMCHHRDHGHPFWRHVTERNCKDWKQNRRRNIEGDTVISSEFPPRGDVYFLRKTITPGVTQR